MTRIHEGLPTKEFEKPDDIVSVQICSQSGLLPVEGLCDCDPRGSCIKTEYFTKDTVPTEYCNTHVKVTICEESGLPATDTCPNKVERIFIQKEGGKNDSTTDAEYVLPDDYLSQTCNLHGGTAAPGTTTPEATTTTPSTEAAADKKAPSKEEEIKASTTNLASKAKQYKTSINSDIIGWLNIPGTGIDYPVTHTNNNTYYMNHNIYKQADRDGALLTDYECNFKNGLPTNTVIYGHNWNNYLAPLADNNPKDKMFDEVHKYADATFAGNHPYIYFSTTEKNYKYQVFAAFYTHVNWTDYLYCYPNATRMQNIISTAKKSSLHDFGVGVSTSDKIISLSTCTRMKGNTNQYRFVVMAKLVG